MFSRFSVSARRVVVLAQEEARLLDHNYIGTEHLLLGLLAESEGVAAQALTDLGVDLKVVRERVAEIIGTGSHGSSGHIPFTPRAKRVLELSLYEAQELGASEIGTEHLLLGLVEEGDGVAAQVLNAMGADAGRVRDRIRETHPSPAKTETPMATIKSAGEPGRLELRIAALERRVTELEGRLAPPEGNDATG